MKTLNTLAMATAFIALTGGAFAQTINSSDIQWNSPSAYTTTSASVNSQSQLRLNSTQVRALQQALRSEGYNIAVDGAYGPNTASALRSFQSQEKLAVTGQANTETLAKLNLNNDAFLNSNIATNTNTSAQSSLKLSRSEVMDMQRALRSEGYNIGVDGVYGPNTASALRSFQSRNSLAVTGQANRETLASLNLISNSGTMANTSANSSLKAQTALQLDTGDIRSMQTALRAQGYNSVAVNGIMDQNTVAALRSYQADKNLSVTGKANFETLANLDLLSRTNSGASVNANATLMPSLVQLDNGNIRMLQQALRSEGYNIGVDGIVGQNTVNALRTFQASNDLQATGELDQETLVMLNLLNRFAR